MARRVILALGLVGAAHGAAAAAETKPESPLKVLSDEIADTKRFMEPLKGLMSGIGKGLAAAKAPKAKAAVPSPVTELTLQSQATNIAKQAAEVKAEAVAPVPKPLAKPSVTEEVEVSAKEHRRIWTLLAWHTPAEMELLSKLGSEAYLGPKLEEWCKDEKSPAACKFENAAKKYCQLIGHVAPSFISVDTLSTVMLGLLEGEATRTSNKATSLFQQSGGAAATFDEVTSSPAFQAKVDGMCESLLKFHPGCRTVAKELVTCQALGEATISLVDSERIANTLMATFSNNAEFQQKRFVPQ